MQCQKCRLFRHTISLEHRHLQTNLSINPNNKPFYISASSNHPPSGLKQIPKSVSKRITTNSYLP